MSRLAVIANVENRRADIFASACRAQGLCEPDFIPWGEVLQDDFRLGERLSETTALRIESPGENFSVERQLIRMGCEAAERERTWPWMGPESVDKLREDFGRVRLQRQWYHGWLAALGKIARVAGDLALPIMNAPSDIAVAFDKEATQRRLGDAGIPVAANLGICEDFDELSARMGERRMPRVFVKPCHSSSASGVIALQTNGRGQWVAVTSAALEQAQGGDRLYNSLALQRSTDERTIRRLVNAVCRQRALTEAWIPKAALGGRNFDLRILVIGARAAHIVVRTSRSPITNLHLGNQRGSPDAVRAALGPQGWATALKTAEAAAACFPSCLYLAVDLMVASSLRHFVVAEVNAFGDLLPNVVWRGMNPCEAELAAWSAMTLEPDGTVPKP